MILPKRETLCMFGCLGFITVLQQQPALQHTFPGAQQYPLGRFGTFGLGPHPTGNPVGQHQACAAGRQLLQQNGKAPPQQPFRQAVVPGPQTQVPFWQTAPGTHCVQLFPHVPQFCTFVFVSVQTPLQHSLEKQFVPHVPQFCGSVIRFRQNPEQHC
jgi:hypothetical protein